MAGGYDVGILIEGNDVTMTDVAVIGNFNMASVYLAGSSRGRFDRIVVDGRDPLSNRKIGRNQPCPCGSKLKFKRCHGAPRMGRGIVSDNSDSVFTDATVVVDANSTGIHTMNGDRTQYIRPSVYVGQELDLESIIKASGLPDDVPRGFVSEAVDALKASKDDEPLRYSKLRMWLTDKGLDTKFIADALVAFGAAVLGAVVGK
ncbi:YecA family protein [Pseudomonas putida]|uniref:YecA family protein n=1 Tax=Pseudomonas putida TaxID=303 RepID=UPI0023E44341|nr:SEC-C domain-containing protein [Pseudomonas putida]MDF3929839.1 SEC-C domain-containing protein [Pseudomonas putida]